MQSNGLGSSPNRLFLSPHPLFVCLREKKSVLCVCEIENECVHVCVCMCVWERVCERLLCICVSLCVMWVSVYMRVCERERHRECMWMCAVSMCVWVCVDEIVQMGKTFFCLFFNTNFSQPFFEGPLYQALNIFFIYRRKPMNI